MELSGTTTATHPVVRAVAEIHRADEAEAGTATYLSVSEKRRLLLELSREVERARGLLLHVIASADDVALCDGARNVADWLAARTRRVLGRVDETSGWRVPQSRRITAGEARRLACTAALVPAVLGGRSEPLDLGRTARLFSPAQRKAMAIRDRGCRAEGCTIPAAWCEAHHVRQPWSRGGRTDLADGSCCAPGTTSAPTTTATCSTRCPTATSGTDGGREVLGVTQHVEVAQPGRT